MLFPDETYEDYKQRIKTISNLNPTQTPYEGCRPTALQQSVSGKQQRNTNLTEFSKTQDSSGRESATSTSNSSGGYKLTTDFFDNIPEAKAQAEQQAATNNSYSKQEQILKIHSSKDVAATKEATNQSPDDHTNPNDTVNEDLSTNPIFLRTCEALIRQYRIRPDFFCQYYKAVSSNSTSPSSSAQPSQTKSIPKKKSVHNSCDKASTKSSSRLLQNSTHSLPVLPVATTPNTTSSEEVQRFTKRSAIYTLPKRRLENSDHIAAIVKERGGVVAGGGVSSKYTILHHTTEPHYNSDGGSGGVSDDDGMELVTCFSYNTIPATTTITIEKYS
ncbi:uncharacterized protein LOC135950768 [Calliphora vicina]|uniref:uncharacterized protein LOC135950768 n=1 Tax=Calliphora vicina TaxID=7373 RepID=UPI00325B2360